MLSSSKASKSGAKETVLLRKATPKYNFAGRKLPKSSDNNVTEEPLSDNHQMPTYSSPTSGMKSPAKPVAVVGASIQSNRASAADFRKGHPSTAVPESQAAHITTIKSTSSIPSLVSGKSAVPDQRESEFVSLTQPALVTQKNVSSSQTDTSLSASTQDNLIVAPGQDGAASEDALSRIDDSTPSPSMSEQLQTVREERDKLRAELNSQLQVNTELKRLLVASVGDDLYERVENLCRDRAQLEHDIGGFSKKVSEDYENLDKISIQADMWRSKYLASRVMTEELSSAKAYLSLQCHDSHGALHQLLNERHELRTNLIESYKVLQQVKNAFDPLNTHKSSSLRSTNVLDLSKSCQQLSEAVRFRLLPTNVVIDVSSDVSTEVWQDSATRAEQFAHQVLSRPVESSGSGSSTSLPGHPSEASVNQYTRYHPATRFENLTINCCVHCKGDINVI